MNFTSQDIENFLNETDAEVVVLIEGIDPATSYTVQARHSYKLEDIEFRGFFAQSVTVDSDGAAVVDFNLFNMIIPDSK